MTPEPGQTAAAPDVLSVLRAAAVPFTAVCQPADGDRPALYWRVRRLSPGQAAQAGVLEGLVGGALAKIEAAAKAPAAPDLDLSALGASVLRSAAQAADRVVMAAVDGVSLDGVTWTPMRVVLPGDDDPAAGTVGIQTMPWGTVWACAEAATGFAREAAALVASFRQRAAGAPADR
jgi:hypothetical protein